MRPSSRWALSAWTWGRYAILDGQKASGGQAAKARRRQGSSDRRDGGRTSAGSATTDCRAVWRQVSRGRALRWRQAVPAAAAGGGNGSQPWMRVGGGRPSGRGVRADAHVHDPSWTGNRSGARSAAFRSWRPARRGEMRDNSPPASSTPAHTARRWLRLPVPGLAGGDNMSTTLPDGTRAEATGPSMAWSIC